jgi:hypothetical protein
MVWLGGPRRGGGRAKPIVLHDPPPGYHPHRPEIPLKDRQRMARRDWILEHIAAAVLIPAAVAFMVIIFLMIAGYH